MFISSSTQIVKAVKTEILVLFIFIGLGFNIVPWYIKAAQYILTK